jgi:hypothetical protein
MCGSSSREPALQEEAMISSPNPLPSTPHKKKKQVMALMYRKVKHNHWRKVNIQQCKLKFK